MHWEILDENRVKLLNEISTLSFINRFAMGGGTALSLRLGLRKSYDFDFFADWHFDPEALWDELFEKFRDRVRRVNEEKRISTLDLYIDGIQVSFFEYKYPTLNKTIPLKEESQISLLSIYDIACMKAIAIIQRGSKKDFFDLYFVFVTQDVDEKKMMAMLQQKYKDKNVLSNLCLSLGYFNDAENDVLPESYVKYSWENIKAYFLKFQAAFFKLIPGK